MDSFLSIHLSILVVFFEEETYLSYILLRPLKRCVGHRKASEHFGALQNRLTLLFSSVVASITRIIHDTFQLSPFIFEYHPREVIHQFDLGLIHHPTT